MNNWLVVDGGKVNRSGGFIGDVRCKHCGNRFTEHYGNDCDAIDPSREFHPAMPWDHINRPDAIKRNAPRC